ncbi:squalene/phytoene synthase family protein, partial [Salmonella enterica]|uniref:squalene/phytoene synthase family protein n=1 Tax=Salmonella enterica TaxID=28901 RepID=UPI003CF6299D
RALQLTNILRDIDEDAAIGRVYLNHEALTAAGVALTTPAAIAAHPGIDPAARMLAAQAHRHFDAAHAVL